MYVAGSSIKIFLFLAMLCGIQDPYFLTTIKTMPTTLEAWSLKHWTAMEVPQQYKSIKGLQRYLAIFVKILKHLLIQ